MYSDNQKKFAVVLNRKHPPGTLLNAYGHLVVGLSSDLGAASTELLSYANEPARLHARISRYPVIALGAKNSSQLRAAYDEATRAQLAINVFVTTMLGASADAQILATADATPESLDFVGIALFGGAEELAPITKKFSLLGALKES